MRRDEHFAREKKILKFYIWVFVACFLNALLDIIIQFSKDDT